MISFRNDSVDLGKGPSEYNVSILSSLLSHLLLFEEVEKSVRMLLLFSTPW